MKWITATLLMLLFQAPWVSAQDDEGPVRSQEERVVHAIEDVPAAIMASARSVAPDVFFNKAESYWQDDYRVYSLTGRLFRDVWTVYVRQDGVVLRSESDRQDET